MLPPPNPEEFDDLEELFPTRQWTHSFANHPFLKASKIVHPIAALSRIWKIPPVLETSEATLFAIFDDNAS
jgi:hypothetical protein